MRMPTYLLSKEGEAKYQKVSWTTQFLIWIEKRFPEAQSVRFQARSSMLGCCCQALGNQKYKYRICTRKRSFSFIGDFSISTVWELPAVLPVSRSLDRLQWNRLFPAARSVPENLGKSYNHHFLKGLCKSAAWVFRSKAITKPYVVNTYLP